MNSRILFSDQEHSWTIPTISFDFSGVTIPFPEMRVIFTSHTEFSALDLGEAQLRGQDVPEENRNKKFWEILECMKIMNVYYDLTHLHMRGNLHLSSKEMHPENEVKAIQTLKVWIRYANKLHKLIGVKTKVKMTDQLIIKIARETKPTLFAMPNNERWYNDEKSEIVQLSPYEDNTRNLEKHKVSSKCVYVKNRIEIFLTEKQSKKVVIA